MNLSKQYDKFAETFSKIHNVGRNSNSYNRRIFYRLIDFVKPGVKLLDLGCGDGFDLLHYREMGAEVYGLDASKKLVEIAKRRLPDADIRVGLFEDIPFKNCYFDIVFSKYAIQTSKDIESIFEEISRVLKPTGVLMYMAAHPFRLYFEKRDARADYFKQKIVSIPILNKAITVREPSHTLNEYLNEKFLQNFDLKFYQEYWEPSAEKIDDRKYPGFFIIIAKKRAPQ